MANNWLKRILQFLRELNLFNKPLSNVETVPQERLTTRIYLLSFIALLLMIIIVAAGTLRITNKIEYLPSQSKFEHLSQQYPDTLKCPCSRFAILYETFVTAHAEIHQVCSSKFVTQAWIDAVYVQRNISLPSSIDDIRPTLSAFWQIIAGFCDISKQAWTETMSDFGGSNLFTPIAINEQLVQTKARAALNLSMATVQTTVTRSLLVIQRTTTGNELISGLATNFYARFTTFGIKILPRMYANCSCLNMNGCPHPSVFNDSQGQLTLAPGLVSDCLIVDGTLASTLECYYDHACLSHLHEQINTDVVPLLTSLDKRFSSNSTIQVLLDELMIDELSIEVVFDSFYSQCNPVYCSYTYSHRFDILFIITTVIGLFSGLSLVLRLIAPFITKIILRCKNRSLPNGIHVEPVYENKLRAVFNRLRQVPRFLGQQLVSFNLFEGRTFRTPKILYRERIMTRLFVLLLAVSAAGFGFHIFFPIQTQFVTIMHPSLDTYQKLYLEHSDSLQCPCSQLSIPYGRFLNVTYVLHQVCSSGFISSTWIDYLALFDPALQRRSDKFAGIDIRVIAPSYFQILNIFCSLATVTIDEAYKGFITTEFVNSGVLSPLFFAQQTQALIQSFIDSTSNDFAQTLNWIRIADQTNQLMTGTNMNTNITVNNDGSVSVVNPLVPFVTVYNETTIMSALGFCSCARTGQICNSPTVIFLNTSNCFLCQHYFIGLQAGCVPLNSLLVSQIAWLYNSTYVEQIRSTFSMGILPKSSPPILEPLNSSVQTRLGYGESWQWLINEMLLETWITNNSRFDLFYYECSPISCSYVHDQRRDIIVAFLLFIAVFGSLNSAIRLLTLLTSNLICVAMDKWQKRKFNQPVHSIGVFLKSFPKKFTRSILTLNLFKSNSVNVATVRNERIYTRVFLLLLISSVITIISYTSLIERNKSVIRSITSSSEYKQFLALYPDSFQCPCTQISIPYGAFVTQLDVNFHPVCTSDFVSIWWINYLTGGDAVPTWLNKNDFRFWSPTFFQSLQMFCTLAKDSIANSQLVFRSSTWIISQVISQVQFNNQINATLRNVQTSIPIVFNRTLELIRMAIQGNALMTTISSNWNFILGENKQSLNASLLSFPVSYDNSSKNTTCSCATSKSCSEPAQMFTPNSTPYYSVDGLLLSCFPVESLLGSSLSCFYTRKCLKALLNAMTLGDRDSEWTWTIPDSDFTPINAPSSRFLANETLVTVVQAMFIESWTQNVSYELFFNACAPNQCTYTYYYRFDALDVLTTFLSVYSGLSLGLRFLVPHLCQLINKIRNRFRIAPLQ